MKFKIVKLYLPNKEKIYVIKYKSHWWSRWNFVREYWDRQLTPTVFFTREECEKYIKSN